MADKASLLDDLTDSSPRSKDNSSDQANADSPSAAVAAETSFDDMIKSNPKKSRTNSLKSFFEKRMSKENKQPPKSTPCESPEEDSDPNSKNTSSRRFIHASSLRQKGSDLPVSKAHPGPEIESKAFEKASHSVPIETEKSHLLTRADERQLSNCQAVLHVFKVLTGPSTVGMPAIIRNGGILFGTVGFLAIGFLNTYASNVIVKCGRILCKRTGVSALRYDELMEMAVSSFADNPRGLKFARIMRGITILMLWLTQFGILALYIQIIGSITHEEVKRFFPSYQLPLAVTQIFVTLCLIPYSLMTNLRILSWFSLFANIIIGVCVVTMLQYACNNLKPASSLPLINSDPWKIMLFMGASVFTVEGVPMVLPIENRVKHPQDFGGFCGVVTLAATLNVTVNLCVGFFGYLSKGQDVPADFLMGLSDFWWYRVVSLLYALMVFLTFTLQLFLPAEFIVTALHKRYHGDKVMKYGFIGVRIGIVIAAYLFASLIPNIQLIMSLFGSSSTVTLLFLLPPIAELMLQSGEAEGLTASVVIRSILGLIFGFVILVAGTYASLLTITQELSS